MDLSIFELSILPIIKIIIVFLLMMIILPMSYSLDKRKMPLLKSIFRYLMQGMFFIMVLAYILTTLKLFENFSLIVISLIVCYKISMMNRRSKEDHSKFSTVTPIYLKLLDMFDIIGNDKRYKDVFLYFWNGLKSRISSSIGKITTDWIVVFILFIFIIAIRFSTRILNPMAMAAMADPYVHLTWAKMMVFNRLFTDGVYPMGYHAVIASLGTIGNVDIYHVVRFMGPIGSSILVIGLYWFIKSITKSRIIAIIGTVAFGLSTYNGLPVEFFRQTLSLSMEFSIAFILPGLVFLHDYIKDGDRRDLILYGFTVVSVTMVHSYGALFFAIGTAALLASGLINRCLNLKNVFWIFITGLGGGLVGMMPIIIGRLQGIDWHIMSANWIESNVRIGSWNEIYAGFSGLLSNTPLWIILCGISVVSVLLVVTIRNIISAKEEKRLWDGAVLILMIIVAILYYGPQNGLSLLDYTRVTMFFTLSVLIAVILCFNHIIEFSIYSMRKFSRKTMGKIQILRMKNFAGIGFVIIFSSAWLYAFPIQLTADDEMAMRPIEYNSAVGIYFQVKRDYPLFSWTLVAPVEQYQEALGYGFHYELWQFVEDFVIDDVKNPEFDIPIPTRFIFIYVEKVPLKIWTNNELDTTQERYRGPTEIYYRDADGRIKLQESIWAWCEAYIETHDNMSVYFEDDVLKVYKVEHDPTRFIEQK